MKLCKQKYFLLFLITISFFPVHASQRKAASRKRKREEGAVAVERPTKKQKVGRIFIPKETSGLVIMVNKVLAERLVSKTHRVQKLPEVHKIVFDFVGWLPYRKFQLDMRMRQPLSRLTRKFLKESGVSPKDYCKHVFYRSLMLPPIATMNFSDDNRSLHAELGLNEREKLHCLVTNVLTTITWDVRTGACPFFNRFTRGGDGLPGLLMSRGPKEVGDNDYQDTLELPATTIECKSKDNSLLAQIHDNRKRNIQFNVSLLIHAGAVARIVQRTKESKNSKRL